MINREFYLRLVIESILEKFLILSHIATIYRQSPKEPDALEPLLPWNVELEQKSRCTCADAYRRQSKTIIKHSLFLLIKENS